MSDENQSAPNLLSVPRKARIEGDISFGGSIVVDGTICGDIRCRSIIVRERGIIEGSIRADQATIMGEVSGDVFANNLTLKTACSVVGNIYHQHLFLENGSYFEGQSRRHSDPLMLAE